MNCSSLEVCSTCCGAIRQTQKVWFRLFWKVESNVIRYKEIDSNEWNDFVVPPATQTRKQTKEFDDLLCMLPSNKSASACPVGIIFSINTHNSTQTNSRMHECVSVFKNAIPLNNSIPDLARVSFFGQDEDRHRRNHGAIADGQTGDTKDSHGGGDCTRSRRQAFFWCNCLACLLGLVKPHESHKRAQSTQAASKPEFHAMTTRVPSSFLTLGTLSTRAFLHLLHSFFGVSHS